MRVTMLARMKSQPLLRFRIDRGLTQAQAADLTGVSINVWQAVENMRFADVAYEQVGKLANALDCEPDQICPKEHRPRFAKPFPPDFDYWVAGDEGRP